MPTASDLVTDLPADFETFGQAVATSMADLLGGTTGQVLSKASNTDMDFTWVTSDDANAIQNTIVDAKGDLISATGSDVPARLAVGANGETLVADSSTSTGLRYIPATVVANPIINGGQDIWQRGTTFTSFPNTSTFTSDRFYCYGNSLAAGITVSRQATNDTTNLPFIEYAARIARDSGITSTQNINFITDVETSNSIPFAGKAVTLSFYARSGANYSPTSSLLAYKWRSGTGTNQRMAAGFTGSTQIATDGSVTLTTTWQRFTITGTVPTNSTQMGMIFTNSPTGTAGANDYYEITGVQVDVGSVALPFRRSGGTIQGELSAAQRYYYRANWDAKAAYPVFAQGGGYSTTLARVTMPLPVNMRVQPTAIDTSAVANMRVQSFNDATSIAPSAITFDTNFTTTTTGFIGATVASGLTANALYYLRGEGSTAYYIGWSAEL
jgi:hypothetical protein